MPLTAEQPAPPTLPRPKPPLRLVNLGCGQQYRDGWVNIDFAPRPPHVIGHDLRTGIPLPDGDVDVVYHSHVLEHFDKQAGERFLRECHRVLRPGGVIRIAVPDLERIARGYLAALSNATEGQPGWDRNYDWMLLELFDQMVRTRSGGEALRYLDAETLPNRDFVIERWGVEAERIFDLLSKQTAGGTPHYRKPKPKPKPLLARVHEGLLRRLLGSEYPLLQSARFRNRGEIHRWMYDRYSLARLLTQAGFEQPVQRGPADSLVEDWSDWHLDTCEDGRTYKPDSLFMEAVKPAAGAPG
jgi:predicted SAM-dependent methyltransferase